MNSTKQKGKRKQGVNGDVPILDEIIRVFKQEIATLAATCESLDDSYVKATQLLYECNGKVVVTGVGKSGLIGTKIAATMVSTGTPAVFMHPGDAMHGDMGIIRPGDVVLAISKSGETEELLTVLLYTRKIGAQIISITANDNSTLAKNSNLTLVTPVALEACPLNLAPTSSTTAALVVGDALAMTLMKLKGFHQEEFALIHPGGKLGKQLLLLVEDVMRSGESNPVININRGVHQMLIEISSKRCGAVSVVDDQDNLLGLVTDFDLRNMLEQKLDLFSLRIADIMNQKPTYIYADEKAVKALEVMRDREKPFLVLPALDRGSQKVVGMIHTHDLLSQGL